MLMILMCWRKKGSRMGLQEDRRENQDNEIGKTEEALRNNI
jgi:hypothetical protein